MVALGMGWDMYSRLKNLVVEGAKRGGNEKKD